MLFVSEENKGHIIFERNCFLQNFRQYLKSHHSPRFSVPRRTPRAQKMNEMTFALSLLVFTSVLCPDNLNADAIHSENEMSPWSVCLLFIMRRITSSGL